MPMTKSQNINSSEYVTMSTAPFLSSGSERSRSQLREPTACRMGSTWHRKLRCHSQDTTWGVSKSSQTLALPWMRRLLCADRE